MDAMGPISNISMVEKDWNHIPTPSLTFEIK